MMCLWWGGQRKGSADVPVMVLGIWVDLRQIRNYKVNRKFINLNLMSVVPPVD